MNDMKRVVDEIVLRCKDQEIDGVSKTLAAFVARVEVIENSNDAFKLQSALDEESVEELINACIDKLSRNDSPQMETIKMQIDFDVIYVETEEANEQKRHLMKNKVESLITSIVNTELKTGNDYETINTLYRQVFSLLLEQETNIDSEIERVVEREIAAALESVFPRIGIKSFIQLPAEDKKSQLYELSNIVKGIRLFNREIGKGGVGISDVVENAPQEATALLQRLEKDKQSFTQICEEYSLAVVYCRQKREAKDNEVLPKEEMIQRWQDELYNRRQYLSYILNLIDEVREIQGKLDNLCVTYDTTLKDLQTLVNSRATLPKEQVYPKFDLVARAFSEITGEFETIQARTTSLGVLQKYYDSFTNTLPDDIVEAASKILKDGPAGVLGNIYKVADSKASTLSGEDQTASNKEDSAQAKNPALVSAEGNTDHTDQAAATRLTLADTPDFMDLPLEYQGFCPVTLVLGNGLLLPGNPGHGVVRYKNHHHVFDNEQMLLQFLENPSKICEGVLKIARRSPELIHLLSLQEYFPKAALNNLTRTGRMNRDMRELLLDAQGPTTVDASTETPVHFIERNIDPSYDWNEWSIRRKALQLVNLRHSKTVSAQTHLSNYRREAETQVYELREKDTQTGISRGTNPPRTCTYITGFRGHSSKFVKETKLEESEGKISEGKDCEEKEEKYCHSKVVTMKFEL